MSEPKTIFSWHQTAWQILEKSLESNQLAHALLVTGEEGLGQSLFAKEWAKCLLTRNFPQKQNLFEQGDHPDYFHLAPEAGSRFIKIEPVRALLEKLSQKAHSGSFQVIVCEPADQLNESAANALLKCVEEPSAGIVWIFVSHYPARLPKTLLSRCQRIVFKKPPSFVLIDQPWEKTFQEVLDQVMANQLCVQTVAEKWSKEIEMDLLLKVLFQWLIAKAKSCLPAAAPQALFEAAELICHLRQKWATISGLNAQNSLELALLNLKKFQPLPRGSLSALNQNNVVP